MTLSHRKKKARKQFRKFRGINKIYNCQDCGKRLSYETHHAYCNACHKQRKVKGLSTAVIKSSTITKPKGKKPTVILIDDLLPEKDV